MHRIATLFICLSLLATCNTPPPMAPRQVIVLTYNIHHGEGTDGVFDLGRLAQVILDSGADLVALQEVDVGTARSGGLDQAAELGRLTGMQATFGEAMPYDGGSYGEAVLSRWPVLTHQVLPLPASPDHEPRAALIVTVQPGWSTVPLQFVATHLDHTDDDTDRLTQVRTLKQTLEKGGLPTLLAGDLNATPDSAPLALFLDESWKIADPKHRPTYPSDKPVRKIDWILLSPASAGLLDSPEVLSAPVASDHSPYRARWVFP